MNRKTIDKEIVKKVPEDIYKSIQRHVQMPQKTKPTQHLWGMESPPSHLLDTVALTIYKDLTSIGYHALATSIAFGYKITDHSLNHNVPLVRLMLKKWADTVITTGTFADWKADAARTTMPKLVNDTNLLMDSSDFSIFRKSSTSRSSSSWSYKLNGPGSRYMFIVDALGRIKHIWGGYSPKLYDGDFLAINKDYIEATFNKGVIIADNHFWRGKTLFDPAKVKFHVNYKKRQGAKKRKRADDGQDDELENVTRTQEAFNTDHQNLRARVESPFGLVKTKFKCLNKPWQESQEQLDCVVWYACAIVTVMAN